MKSVAKQKPFIDKIFDLLVVVASVLIFFMLVAVCYDVIARYFFNSPTTWVGELSGIILLFIPFLLGGWILKDDGHVKMELLLEIMPPKLKTRLTIVTSFIALLACLILCIYGVKISWYLYQSNYLTDTYLRLPKGPLMMVIPLGFSLLFIQFVRKIKTELDQLRCLKDDGGQTNMSE